MPEAMGCSASSRDTSENRSDEYVVDPWENGYIESFNGKLRDELLNGEVFSSVPEAKVLTDAWRQHYNHHRPHSALGYRPPAPVVIKLPIAVAS